MTLEACVGSLDEALKAEMLGAHQIELCDRLDLDGTSPGLDTIQQVCRHVQIPIKVIINPNPFNYTYSVKDVGKISNYIKELNELPIKGIVFGPADKDGFPDLDLLSTVTKITALPITFHKAIDSSPDIIRSTKLLTDQNVVKYILSSGGQKTAVEGISALNQMKALLKDTRINLIAAGSITSDNLTALHNELNLSYYHGKKIVGDLHSTA